MDPRAFCSVGLLSMILFTAASPPTDDKSKTIPSKDRTDTILESKLEEEYVKISTTTPEQSKTDDKLDEDYVHIPAMMSETIDSSGSSSQQTPSELLFNDEWVHVSGTVDMDFSSLTEFEKEYVFVPEPPTRTLQPGESWTELEREYVAQFERLREGRLARWKAMRILDTYKKEALKRVCQASYMRLNTSSSRVPKMQSHELIFAELVVGSEEDKNFWMDVDVVECETEKFEKFYVIEGRRANSVYFVKPSTLVGSNEKPKLFVFDKRFRSEIDLQYRFTDLAGSILGHVARSRSAH